MTGDESNLKFIKDKIGMSNLDGNDKIRAIYRLDQVFSENGGVCEYRDVDHFFTWERQPEGSSFWNKINGIVGYNGVGSDADDYFFDDLEEDEF